MGEWKTYRLGEICTTKGAQYSISEHWPIIQYLDTGNITYNKINDIQSIIIGKDTLPSRARKKVKKDDIIFSCVRPNQCHFGILTNPPDNLLVSTGFAVISVDKKFAVPHYVYYYITQDHIINYLQNIGEQAVSTYPTIKASDIENLKITLPPLEEQQRIAGILGSLDDKIELNRRINANLEAQAQALFRSWFVDFEPFRDGPFVDSQLGKIPQGWKVGTASEFYKNITIGKTPPRKEHQWFSKNSHDIVWVSIADMGNCGLSICNSSEYLTPEAIKKFNICIVPVNTVLLSFKLTIGRVAIADKELATNEAIAHFQTQHNTLEYTYLALKNYEFSSLGSTSSIATAVNSKIIKSMPWMMPSDDVLNQFHNVLSPIFNGIRNNIQEITRLSALRDTLLPKLMAGEF